MNMEEEKRIMKYRKAFVIALTAALLAAPATYALADYQGSDTQAPRGQDDQAPRAVDRAVQVPRG
jgi:hypothetical protein